jgi:hypothetical protein
MNIQHTQQIQHIRHAKQYRSAGTEAYVRNSRRRRPVSVVAVASAAFIAVGGFFFPANASHSIDEGPGVASATIAASDQATSVTSPCFAVRTADRWAKDSGGQPRCAHAYGASTAFAAEGNGQSRVEQEAGSQPDTFLYSVDHIYGYDQFVGEATDGWSHQIDHVRVTDESAATSDTDGWTHRIGHVAVHTAPSVDASAGNRDHWRSCFYTARAFHVWEQVQVGTPVCAPANDGSTEIP